MIEPRSFRTRLCSVLILSWDPLFIGTLRTATEVGAQEGKWNFQGRDDVIVPIRKLKLPESEEPCTALFPRAMSSQWKEEGGGGKE